MPHPSFFHETLALLTFFFLSPSEDANIILYRWGKKFGLLVVVVRAGENIPVVFPGILEMNNNFAYFNGI